MFNLLIKLGCSIFICLNQVFLKLNITTSNYVFLNCVKKTLFIVNISYSPISNDFVYDIYV